MRKDRFIINRKGSVYWVIGNRQLYHKQYAKALLLRKELQKYDSKGEY